jgi:Protein of unknown function (DUF4231)
MIENQDEASEKTEVETSEEKTVTPPHFMGKGFNTNSLPRSAPALSDIDFIKERVDNQINWFEAKSSWNQRQYRYYKRIEFTIAASVPVLVTFIGSFGDYPVLDKILQITAAVCGVISVVVTKQIEVNDFQNYWINYRILCESLRNERYKYLTHTEPYDEEDAFPLFVGNIESILSKSSKQWELQKAKNSNDKKQKEESDESSESNSKELEAKLLAILQKYLANAPKNP